VRARAALLLPGDELPGPLDNEFVLRCLSENERGDGAMFAALHGRRIRYNMSAEKPRDQWYVWNKHYWQLDDYRKRQGMVDDVALEYLRVADELHPEVEIILAECEAMGIKAEEHDKGYKVAQEKDLRKRAFTLRGQARALKAVDWSQIVDMSFSVYESDFDRDPWLLPCANGVIDLRTGALTEGRPEDLLSRAIPIEYDEHADTSEIHKFVMEITGSEEITAFIKRSFGTAITGLSSEQYIWIFIGPGRNGKGVLFSLLGDVMGPCFHSISPAMLMEQKNPPSPNAASEYLYSLLRKRVIVGSETKRSQKIDNAEIKRLTGDDPITCRPNFRSEITFDPTHSLFLLTNFIPWGLAEDFAIKKRMLIVNLPFMFVDDPEDEARKSPQEAHLFKKLDTNMKKTMKAYRQGFLRWVVEGCLEWQKIGLAPPPKVMEAVDEAVSEQDDIKTFIDDCLNIEIGNDNKRLPVKQIDAVLDWWWKMNLDSDVRNKPGIRRVNKSLRDRGYKVEKDGGVYKLFGGSVKLEILSAMGERS